MKKYGVLSYVKSQRFNHIFALSASLFLLLLLITTIVPVYQKIEYTEATAGTATASTLTFSSDNSVASVNLIVDSPTGTFATSSENEKARFSINTNNYTGYTLVLKSSGTNTNLAGNNTNIATIPTTTTYETFSSDGASGQLLNNKWGYIPSYYNSSANTTNYYPSPTSSDVATINVTNSANSSDDTYTIGLGFRADYTNSSGTYANDTFVVEFVANSVVYSISFDDNTGDESVSDIPSTAISGSTTTTGVTLPDTVPTRTGYTFKAWCLGAVSDNGTTCTGTEFAAGADFGIDQTVDSNMVTLYALWTINTYSVTVNFAGSGVSSVIFAASGQTTETVSTSGGTVSLVHNVTYTITMVFASGYEFSSWAINNSNYGTLSSTTANPATFTPNASSANAIITATGKAKIYMQDQTVASLTELMPNVGDTATLYDVRDDATYKIGHLADGRFWMLDNLSLGSSTLDESISANNTNIPANYSFALPSSTTPWNTNSATAYTTAMINTDYANTTATNYGSGSGKVGVYYNFCAASAGTYCYNSNSGTSNSQYDICPAGWRIPKSYTGLYVAYNSDWNDFLSALSVTMSGEIWNSAVGKQGDAANYWSNTRNNSGHMSRMWYEPADSGSGPAYADAPRGMGWVVRCVKKENPVTIAFTTSSSNAGNITLDGITYSNGQTASIEPDVYNISATRTAFGSWSTAGDVSVVNASGHSTQLIVSGGGTLTLTESPSGFLSSDWSTATESGASFYIRGAYNNDGNVEVRCPMWAENFFGNPTIWYTATWDSDANAYRCDLKTLDFHHYGIQYGVHVYIGSGSWSGSGISGINIPARQAPNPVTVNFATSSHAGNIKVDDITYTNGQTEYTLNGGTYSNGQTASMEPYTYNISATRTAFGSWSTSGGVSVADTSSSSTKITISGSGTLTLTERSSGFLSATWGTATASGASLYISGAFNNDGNVEVRCPIWASDHFGDPTIWYVATWDSGASAYRCDLKTSDFGYYDTTYAGHIYIGNGSWSAPNVYIPAE